MSPERSVTYVSVRSKTKQQSFQLTASPLERAAKPAIYRRILVSVLSLRAADSVLGPGCREHLRVFLCFSGLVARMVNTIATRQLYGGFGGSFEWATNAESTDEVK